MTTNGASHATVGAPFSCEGGTRSALFRTAAAALSLDSEYDVYKLRFYKM